MRMTDSQLLQYADRYLVYSKDEGCFYRRTLKGLKPVGYSAVRNKPYGRPYSTVKIYGHTYSIHRLVFLMEHGASPIGEIDHIDGDTTNNRIGNLRDVTNVQNRRNQKRHSRNKSGHTGVFWHKKNNRWEVSIGNKGKTIYLGVFYSYEEAVECRLAAEKKYNYSPTHGKR